MRGGEQYAGGFALNFFNCTEFEDQVASETEQNDEIQARNLLRILMIGQGDKWLSLLSWRALKAVFIQRNHQLTQAMRLAFQQGFNHIFSQLQDVALTPKQHNQVQLFISNCLTYLPFADLTPYESFLIPQYVNGKWEMIGYKVVPIELTPTSGFKKLFIHDYDRVFAYGLEPIKHDHATPHLIFMGTTYPAGQGFATTINTDLEAFETAGKKLYRTGKKNLTSWIDHQRNKPHVCGVSLGGALSLLLAIDQGDKLSRIDALNPPGLYHAWRKSRFDHWDELKEKPEVYIQKQGNDLVSCFGVWKKDWHVLHVIPPSDKQGANQAIDHTINYAGFAKTQFIGVDTVKDNSERKHRNLWLYTLLRSGAYYCGMIPYRYLCLPVFRFILAHKLQLALMLPLIALFSIAPLVVVSTSLAMNTLLSAAMISYLLTDLIHFLTQKDSDLSKLLTLLSSLPLLRQNFGLITLLGASMVVTSSFLLPSLIPVFILAAAATPFAYCLFNKISNNLFTLIGYADDQLPTCQHPKLPRNKSLDIYTNTMQATFSYKEIGAYYRAKRCVLNGEPLLPAEDPNTQKFFKSTGLTKREIVCKSQDPSFQDTKITFSATTAKIHNIRQIAHLVHRFGFYQEDKLRFELQRTQQNYLAGKHI